MRYVMEADIINDEECIGCKFLVKHQLYFCNLTKLNLKSREEIRPDGLYIKILRYHKCPFIREEKPTNL